MVLELVEITKKFAKVTANDKVSLTLRKGEVLALLGENGAGKTTLMNCVCGLYHPTGGYIRVNEKQETIRNCQDATKLGIGMIHQHFMLIPELTVAENVILGLNRKKDFFTRINDVANEVRHISDTYGFGIDPKSLIRDLPIGMQQRVEIIKTLYRRASIIILDEATAVLTPQETQQMYQIVKKLTAEGKSIILITHKLEEVMQMSDRVVVLRDGKAVGTLITKDTNPHELANLMVGRDVLFDFHVRDEKPKNECLEVSHLCVQDRFGVTKVDDLTFTLRQGEILGIAGVDGNGQSELAEAITGMLPFKNGTITVNGKAYRRLTTRMAYKSGMSHIPQDRQTTGLILSRTLAMNSVLMDYRKPEFSKFGLLDIKKIRAHGKRMIQQFNIKAPDENTPVKELSGGNKQKVILARELYRAPKILVAVQPTRGLDIGATEFVRQKLIDERDKGTGVLLISAELDEILQISDRIAVMYKGKFMGIVDRNEAKVDEIGLMMAGSLSMEDFAHAQ